MLAVITTTSTSQRSPDGFGLERPVSDAAGVMVVVLTGPPGRSVSTGSRILEVAQELVTRQGYDKTSLRDIAERLQITKAALYYYFQRKEEILIALHLRLHTLGESVIAELEAAPDGAGRVAIWPRLANEMIDFMVDNQELLLLHKRNRSAFESLDPALLEDGRGTEARFARIISSPAIARRERVRMAAMVGVITEIFGESAAAFTDVAPDELADLVREAIADLTGVPQSQLHADV